MHADDTEVTVTCRCGQLRLAVRGAPLMTVACHCSGCQAMTASAFSLGAMFHQDAVVVEGDTVLGGLRGQSQHHCCPDCLSWIYTRAPAFGPMMNIHSASLGGLPQQPPWLETCTAERLAWVSTGAVRSYPHFPEAEELPGLLTAFAAERTPA